MSALGQLNPIVKKMLFMFVHFVLWAQWTGRKRPQREEGRKCFDSVYRKMWEKRRWKRALACQLLTWLPLAKTKIMLFSLPSSVANFHASGGNTTETWETQGYAWGNSIKIRKWLKLYLSGEEGTARDWQERTGPSGRRQTILHVTKHKKGEKEMVLSINNEFSK